MAYQTQHLDTIVNCARISRDLGGRDDAEAALDDALNITRSDCLDIVKGKRAGEWTAQQVNEFRDLLGVISDVQKGFVSPTIGNVRSYCLRALRSTRPVG